MKIIDINLRPPVDAMKNDGVFDLELTPPFAAMFGGSYMGRSARERSVPLLMEEMDACGICTGVMPLRRSPDPFLNENVSALIRQYPERFIGLVGIDPGDTETALREIETFVTGGDFLGINMEPSHSGMYVDDERIFPIYQYCQDHDIPIRITYAAAVPDATAIMPQHIEAVAKTFPRLRVCLGHGAFPYFQLNVAVLFSYPNIYLSPDSYIMGLPGYRDYVDAANTICENQIVFGSSYPIHDLQRVVDFYCRAGFREEVLEKVFYHNARRFLGLDKSDPAPWRSDRRSCPVVNLNKFK